jgi:hypothetical protein
MSHRPIDYAYDLPLLGLNKSANICNFNFLENNFNVLYLKMLTLMFMGI